MIIERVVLVCHLLVAGLIIALVLLQRGKGAEAGTGFGAGASGTVFGARGSASFFSRATAVLATLFFATSLALAYFATQVSGPTSVVDSVPIEDAPPAFRSPPDDEVPSITPLSDPSASPAVGSTAETPDGESADQ